MMKLKLTRKERKVIRKVIKIELKSLDDVLSSQVEIIEMCNESECIDVKDVNMKIQKAIDDFREVRETPENLLKLDQSNLSIFIHILENHLDETPEVLKRSLRRKLFTWEKILYHPN